MCRGPKKLQAFALWVFSSEVALARRCYPGWSCRGLTSANLNILTLKLYPEPATKSHRSPTRYIESCFLFFFLFSHFYLFIYLFHYVLFFLLIFYFFLRPCDVSKRRYPSSRLGQSRFQLCCHAALARRRRLPESATFFKMHKQGFMFTYTHF